MTKLERLQQQQAAIEEKRKVLGKEIAAEKRKIKQQEAAMRRAAEQTEAMAILEWSKRAVMTVGDKQISAYDWIMNQMLNEGLHRDD